MHVLVSLISVIALFRYGKWREWKSYHNSMLFIALGNLLYNFVTANHFLWRFNADFLSNHTLTEILYTFIVFPSTTLIFLSNYPTSNKGRIVFHYFQWIFIYISFELIFVLTNHIEYQYGWNLGWSFLFDLIMFPTLRIHLRKPLLAYIISAIVAISVVLYFHVPVHLPVEKR